MTTTLNGNVRKSLAEQIDRFDGILDGLAENLSGAVADAVRETVGLAVKEAVQAVLIEVLSNPAMLERLRGGAAPATPARAPRPDGVAQAAGTARAWASAGWAAVRQACAAGLRGAARLLDTGWQHTQVLWTFRRPLLVAVAVGIVSGTATFAAGPWVVATVGSVAGFTAATAAQLVLTLRRVLAQLTTADAQP